MKQKIPLYLLTLMLIFMIPMSVQASNGNLQVTSIPTGASVYVDGVLKGSTPQTGMPLTISLAPSQYQVSIRKTGYVTYDIPVIIESGLNTYINRALVPASVSETLTIEVLDVIASKTSPGWVSINAQTSGFGTIIFTSDGSQINSQYLSNDYAGFGFQHDYSTSTGSHVICAISAINQICKFVTLDVSVTPTPAPTASQNFGILRVATFPSGVTVSVNGEIKGQTPLNNYFELQLSPGSYLVSLSKLNYYSISETAIIDSNSVTTISKSLVLKTNPTPTPSASPTSGYPTPTPSVSPTSQPTSTSTSSVPTPTATPDNSGKCPPGYVPTTSGSCIPEKSGYSNTQILIAIGAIGALLIILGGRKK